MLTIGIDPDLHDLAIGFWVDGRPVRAYVIHVPKTKGRTGQLAVLDMLTYMQRALSGQVGGFPKAIAVEAQTLRRTGMKKHKRPEDIVVLGNVAGAALAFCTTAQGSRIFFPTPEEWKGQIPKAAMQARLYTDLGWGYERVGNAYARPLKPPPAFFTITASQWEHVGDALLLARWAAEQVK